MTEAEIQGRAVVQHYFTELEKIAYSAKVRSLYRGAREAEQGVADAAGALGASRFVPFTKAHRAYYGHAGVTGSGVKGRAREAARQAESQASRERGALLSALESGKGNSQDIIRRLGQGPKKTGPVQRAKRAVGAAGPVENPDFEKKRSGMSPLARKALLGTGAVAVGAGGLYAGQQYLSGQKGYGQY